jgi:predicted flap endonuclease-1-like 5' DNA nuclease
MNWCILIPLLVGAICALLGYLLGKLLGGGNNDADLDVWRNKVTKLESDLDACRASKSTNVASSFAATTATAVAFNADAARAVFGKTIKEDDLTVVEGIGPKISELFNNHGINTWKELSEASLSTCQRVLDNGGERFKVHNPGTWADQAKMAYEGKWKALLKWQDELDGGK